LLEGRSAPPDLDFDPEVQATNALLTLFAHQSPPPVALAPAYVTPQNTSILKLTTCPTNEELQDDRESEQGLIPDACVAEDVFIEPMTYFDDAFWAYPSEEEPKEDACPRDVSKDGSEDEVRAEREIVALVVTPLTRHSESLQPVTTYSAEEQASNDTPIRPQDGGIDVGTAKAQNPLFDPSEKALDSVREVGIFHSASPLKKDEHSVPGGSAQGRFWKTVMEHPHADSADNEDHDGSENGYGPTLEEPVTPHHCTSPREMPDLNHRGGSTNSFAPIIVDTNGGQPIVIEDTDDESEDVDITDNPLTWPGSQRRARSRPLRSQDGTVSWSDTRFERITKASTQKLWMTAQDQWMTMRDLSCSSTSKNVKGFNKIMTQIEYRTQRNNGIMTFEDAEKLDRNFERMTGRKQRRLRRKQKKIVRKVERTMKELHEEVELTTLMEDHPMGDGDTKDGDYTPGAKLPAW
jgi:hypothetical protein